MHAATRVLTCPVEEDVLDRAREDPDDEEDALAARRPAFFRRSSPWASISNHVDLSTCISARAFWKSRLPDKPPRTGRQAKSGSQRSHKDFQVVLAVWRNPRRGTFCASEGEPRISSDISQWTDRYSIASGRSRAPSASLNLLLAISTRSLPRLSSHGGSTRTVPEKVHAVPLTRKPLSFPWLSRNLSVFLGSVFSCVSSIYVSCNGMPPWIFSHSNSAASIHFLHFRRLADFACT